MSAIITIKFVVPFGYREGDYAQLHSNNGSGNINWNDPLTEEIFELFPDRGGIFGFGLALFGHHRFGHAHSSRTNGFGHAPFGKNPFGYGASVIEAKHKVDTCGEYKFGFACYDKFDNSHEGSPEEGIVVIHIAPPAPSGLKKNSYDKDTDILVLDVA